MKSFAGLRGVTALEFAAGRDIFVWVDEDGLIYRAGEYDYLSRPASPQAARLDRWQATA